LIFDEGMLNTMVETIANQMTENIEITRKYLRQQFPKMDINKASPGEVSVDDTYKGYFFLVMDGIRVKHAVFCMNKFLENTPSDITLKMFEDVDLANYIKKNKGNSVLIQSTGLSFLKGIYRERYHDFK
jgi:hypothetical protein